MNQKQLNPPLADPNDRLVRTIAQIIRDPEDVPPHGGSWEEWTACRIVDLLRDISANPIEASNVFIFSRVNLSAVHDAASVPDELLGKPDECEKASVLTELAEDEAFDYDVSLRKAWASGVLTLAVIFGASVLMSIIFEIFK